MLAILLACFVAYGTTIYRMPFIIARPSFIVGGLMLLQINVSAALDPTAFRVGFQRLADLTYICAAFPIAVLLWTAITPRLTTTAYDIARRCASPSRSIETQKLEKTTLAIAACSSIFLLAIYFAFVPPTATGLYAIIFNPDEATQAREESLKLLEFSPARYGYAFHIHLFAPVIIGLVWLRKEQGAHLSTIASLAGIFLILASASLSGARSMAASGMLTLAVTHYLRVGPQKGKYFAATVIACTLILVALITVARARQSGDITAQGIAESLRTRVVERIFYVPFRVGVLYNRYAQDRGEVGVRAIRPIAFLSGERYVPLPVVINRVYSQSSIKTSFSNAGFLFDFQAAFGLYTGAFVAFVCLACLDFLLLAFRWLNGYVLIALLATFITSCPSLINIAFSTAFLTNGIFLSAAWAYLAGNRLRQQSLGRNSLRE